MKKVKKSKRNAEQLLSMCEKDQKDKILEFIDSLLQPLIFFDILSLKYDTSIELISHVKRESNKTIPEAVVVFLTVARDFAKSKNLCLSQEFIKENSDLICKTAIKKKAQGNLPSRALPLLDIFEKRIKTTSISLIELGASYGIIGRCLLNPAIAISKKDRYFYPKQQIPENPREIDCYLGIELDPPEKSWIFTCLWEKNQKKNLKHFLDDMPTGNKFNLHKGNAFGFSELETVKQLISQNSAAIVVLTSFMLYQYNEKTQKQLIDEILAFTRPANRYWINQETDTSTSTLKSYIELDGVKIIELSDDSCRNWNWLS